MATWILGSAGLTAVFFEGETNELKMNAVKSNSTGMAKIVFSFMMCSFSDFSLAVDWFTAKMQTYIAMHKS
jgi:hypothetical protein